METLNLMKNVVKTLLLSCVVIAASAQAGTHYYFVHNDHLGTPQMMTDDTQEVVWQVESQKPFGEVAVNEDPDMDGVDVALNVRFPGQYYDAEIGVSYNYFRTYDASLGRYVQSDPIGLNGGINTYGYVAGNPLKYIDPMGLDFGFGVDSSQAGGNGHTTLYFQGPSGGWYAYDQGAAGNPSIGGNLGYLFDLPAGVNIQSIDGPPDDALIYSSSQSQDAAITSCANQSQNSHNNGQAQYNLFSNNCTDAAVDVLACAGIQVPNSAFSPQPNNWFEDLQENGPVVCRQTRRGIRCEAM